MEEWLELARCLECKQIINREMKFASEFLLPVCPKCGAKNNVEPVTARYKNKGVWYKPSTWGKWEWETR